MCLNCGCMRAHDDMGKAGVNLTYEDIKRAAEANDGPSMRRSRRSPGGPQTPRTRSPAKAGDLAVSAGQVADPSIGR
jgi:hypothetical protein